MLDCPMIIVPGVGQPWTRFVFWIRGEVYLALAIFSVAFRQASGQDILDHAPTRDNIPRHMYGEHTYVPAWWILEAFPEAEERVNEMRELAERMRYERQKERSKHPRPIPRES